MTERTLSRTNTWSKQERLYLKKDIETLFREGEAFSVPYIRVVYRKVNRPLGEWSPIRLGIVVPKKRLRKAVQRNQVKRWIKEAWRLQKHDIYALIPEDTQWHVFFIYTGRQTYSFIEAEKHVKRIITQWSKLLSHDS